MKKVIIIGCPGSGKSTFARRLRDKIKLSLYYLDMIFHLPDRTTIPREEFDARLGEILNKDEWIIDGNYQRTIEMRLKECDTVFLLDYPTSVCLERAISRVGKEREEIPLVEEELDEEFKQSILDFKDKDLPKIYELLEKYGEDKEVIIFKTRQDSDEYLDNLKETK